MTIAGLCMPMFIYFMIIDWLVYGEHKSHRVPYETHNVSWEGNNAFYSNPLYSTMQIILDIDLFISFNSIVQG